VKDSNSFINSTRLAKFDKFVHSIRQENKVKSDYVDSPFVIICVPMVATESTSEQFTGTSFVTSAKRI
jgi:hypothetical protein